MKMHDLRRTWIALALVVALLATACGGPDATTTGQEALDQQAQGGEQSSTTPQAPVQSGRDESGSADEAASAPGDTATSSSGGDSEINYGEPGQPFSVEWPIPVPLQLAATEYTPELCEALQDFNTLYRSDLEVNTLRFNGRNDAIISAAEAIASLDAPGAEIASFFEALASMFREGAALSAEASALDTESLDYLERWDEIDRRRLDVERRTVFLHDQVGIGARVELRCGIRLQDGLTENKYPTLRPLLPAPAITYPIVQQGISKNLEFANIRAEVSWGEPVEVDRARGIEDPTFDGSAEAALYLYFDVRPTDELYSGLQADHIELVLADGGRIVAGAALPFTRLDPNEWISDIASVPLQFAPLDRARVRRPDLTGAVIEITRFETVLRLPLDG